MFAVSLNPIEWITDGAAAIFDATVGPAFDFMVSWFTDPLVWLSQELSEIILNAGSVDAVDELFVDGGPASIIVWLALSSVVVGLMLQAGLVAWRSDTAMSDLTDTLMDLPVTLVQLMLLPSVAIWVTDVCDATAVAIGGEALATGLPNLFELNAGMPGFIRVILAILLMVLMGVLYVFQIIRGHLLTTLIVLGPLLIAMRSWNPARTILEGAVKLFAMLSVTPIITTVTLAISLYRFDATGAVDVSRSLGVVAGMLLAVVAPFIADRLFPIGDSIAAGLAGGAVVAGAALAVKAVGVAAGGPAGAAAAAPSRTESLTEPNGQR